MTPTQAIRLAAAAVGAPVGSGTRWTIVGPYYTGRADGPYTEYHTHSYWSARDAARQWRIGHALALLGVADDTYGANYPSGDWRTVVRCLART